MKCKLCGAEWVERNVHFHPDNACPLSGVCTYRALIVAINEAIEEARKDTRKPEDCTEYGSNYWDALPLIAVPETELVRCKMGLKKQHCPCAYFAKKEKS